MEPSNVTGSEGVDVTVDSHVTKIVSFFRYLGVTLTEDGRSDEDTSSKMKQEKWYILALE